MENKNLYGCGECNQLFKNKEEKERHLKSKEHKERNMPPAPTEEDLKEAAKVVERSIKLDLRIGGFSERAMQEAVKVIASDLKDDYVKFIVSGRFGDLYIHYFARLFSLDLTQEQEDYIFERFKEGNKFNMFVVGLVEDGIK